jgi:hypothetical protein
MVPNDFLIATFYIVTKDVLVGYSVVVSRLSLKKSDSAILPSFTVEIGMLFYFGGLWSSCNEMLNNH